MLRQTGLLYVTIHHNHFRCTT